MRKLNVVLGAFALAAVVSCSNDEVVSQQKANYQANQSIGFSPLATNVTRSTVYTPSSMFTNFRVVGLWTTAPTDAYIQGKHLVTGSPGEDEEQFPTGQTPTVDAAYMGFGTTHAGSGKAGLEIVNNNGAWDYKDQSLIQYWPYAAELEDSKIKGFSPIGLNFRAVTPANTDLDLVTMANWAYTTPDVANMVDICYAKADGETSSPVTLPFHHLLSQIIFKAVKPNNYVVDIKAIEIGGIGTSATFTSSNFSTLSKTSQFSASTPKSFQGFTGAAFSVPDDEDNSTQVTPAKQELLLIPQVVNAWDKKSKATASGQGYLMVNYRAKLASASEWATGSGEGYTEAYFPLSISWLAGNKYIYTLCFGGIKDPENPGGETPPGNDPEDDTPVDEDGTPKAPSVPITFTATLDDWTEQHVDVNTY